MPKYAVFNADDQQVSDNFPTKEEALTFCEEHGIDYDYYEIKLIYDPPPKHSQPVNFSLSLVENLEKYIIALRCVDEDEMMDVVEDLAAFVGKIEDHFEIKIKRG